MRIRSRTAGLLLGAGPPDRVPRRWRGTAPASPPSSWPGLPATGVPPVTRDRGCWPACGPGRPLSWHRRRPRPSSSISARELWDRAPGAAASSPLDRVAVLDRAAEAAAFAGRAGLAVALATQALGQIDAAAEPLRTGALLDRLGRYHWFARDSSAAMAAIERAVATVPADPPTRERARVLAAHGRMLMLVGCHSQAMARCEEALAVARQRARGPRRVMP